MIPRFTIYQPNGWSNSILPIDVLHKLINEMNNVIDYINNMEDRSVERAKEYTDSQIDIVEADIAATNNTIDQINNNLQASIRSLNQSITVLQSQLSTYGERLNEINSRELDHYAEIGRTITQIYSDMRDLGAQLRNYADLKDIVLKEQLEAEIEELRVVINNVLEVETIDGLTGLKRSVRQILSTYIIDKVKRRGGNRFALTWGQMKIDTDYGWLAKYNYTIVQGWLLIAPTWYNFMKPTKTPITSQTGQNRQITPLNTWGSFVNNTALYILNLISVEQQISSATPTTGSINELYSYFDVFDYQQWSSYRYGSTIPSILNEKHVTDTAGSTQNNYKYYIKSQVITWVSYYFKMDGLYYSTTSESYLFDSSNVANLLSFILGVRANPFDSSIFD